MFPGSRNVPAVDGSHIYTCGPYGDLYCIDLNSHKLIWDHNVWTDFGDKTKPYILYEGHFYAQYGPNNKRDGLTCRTVDGEIKWKTKRDPDFNKGSMILADGLILDEMCGGIR